MNEQRELKFRVWDKREKRMSRIFSLANFAVVFVDADGVMVDTLRLDFITDRENQNRFDVMQFIGLADRYGTGIYENDILTATEKRGARSYTGVVQYKSTVCEFHLQVKDFGYSFLSFYETYDLNIIGNIYENAELIKL